MGQPPLNSIACYLKKQIFASRPAVVAWPRQLILGTDVFDKAPLFLVTFSIADIPVLPRKGIWKKVAGGQGEA